ETGNSSGTVSRGARTEYGDDGGAANPVSRADAAFSGVLFSKRAAVCGWRNQDAAGTGSLRAGPAGAGDCAVSLHALSHASPGTAVLVAGRRPLLLRALRPGGDGVGSHL